MTQSSKQLRPQLEAAYFRPRPVWSALYFGYSLAMYFGCGYVCFQAATSSWPLWLQLPTVAAMALLASNGLHLLGWIAHEGIHLSLAKNKTNSVILGSLAGSVLLFSSIGLGISHWPHHRFTNEAGDPDTALQSKQQTFWRRFFLARVLANRKYMSDAVALLLRKPRESSYRLPFQEDKLWRLNALGFAFLAAFLGFYLWMAMIAPVYAWWAFLLPYLLLIPITGLRIYVEHAGTEPGEFRDARSYVSPFYTVLLFGNNYHLEHHLYPSVPAYNLPAVHRKLAAAGYYERFGSPIVQGVFPPFEFTRRHHSYPDAGLRRSNTPTASAEHPDDKQRGSMLNA